VIKGVEYAIKSHLAAGKREGHKGSVANVFLTGGKSNALNKAVNAAVVDGVQFAVAAGNENVNAGGSNPASADVVIGVGAPDFVDQRASRWKWKLQRDYGA